MPRERNPLAAPTYCSPVKLSTIRYTPPTADVSATQSSVGFGLGDEALEVFECQMHSELSGMGGSRVRRGRINDGPELHRE